MTASTRGSFPHPVLDQSDDVQGTFEILNVTVTPSIDDVEVRFSTRLTNPDVQALIDQKRAVLSCRWSCSATIAAGDLAAQEESRGADTVRYRAWLDQQDVRRTVRVDVRVLAAEEIAEYRPKGQHPDYGDASFTLLPGDVLADGGYFEFEPDKLYDPLSPPIGSCFRFVAGNHKRGVKVRFDDDEYINVVFPEALLPGLASLAARPDLQIAIVVMPALMETIQVIKASLQPGADADDLKQTSWYEPIKTMVEDVGTFETPSFELAQKILGHCLDQSLQRQYDEEDDE